MRFGFFHEGSGRSVKDLKWQRRGFFLYFIKRTALASVGCGLQGSQPRAGRLLWGSEEKLSGSEETR